MQNKLFKKSSVERFSSPEKLNDYIQVANPGSWIVLGAALSLLLGVLIWGFFGELTETTAFSGVVQEGALRCYVDSAASASLQTGMEVSISPTANSDELPVIKGTVTSIADFPLSYAEASVGIESDYVLAMLNLSSWNIEVEVSAEEPLFEGMIYAISAVTDTQRPIDLVFQ